MRRCTALLIRYFVIGHVCLLVKTNKLDPLRSSIICILSFYDTMRGRLQTPLREKYEMLSRAFH